MRVDQRFLRAIQAAGWRIKSVAPDFATVICPNKGCQLATNIRPEGKIPIACVGDGSREAIHVESYDQGRKLLRARREELFLTIAEVEELSGATTDHLAKAEKDDFTKTPNADLFIWWAASLGFKVMLVPGELPPMSLRVVADSRDKIKPRAASQAHFRGRRSGSSG